MSTDKEALIILKAKALQSENKDLKHRIKSAIHYIERATELGFTTGCDDIFDVIVGVLNGDIS